MGTNGITHTRGRLARAARLMRGLGRAVGADKRGSPGVDHEVLLFIIVRRVHPSTYTRRNM